MLVILASAIFGRAAAAEKSVEAKLAAAKEQGKSVLMVVSDSHNRAENLKTLVTSTIDGLQGVVLVEMDRDYHKNRELASELRLEQAPIPMLLIFSNEGQLLGGLTEAQATEKSILGAIPTPKFNEISSALRGGKAVVVMVSNEVFESHKSANKVMDAVKGRLLNGVEIVKIDTNDSAEANVIRMLNIEIELVDSHIIVMNSHGRTTARFDTLPEVGEVVEAALEHNHSSTCGCGGC